MAHVNKDINRFYNSDYHPSIRVENLRPQDHLSQVQTLSPDMYLTPPTQTGRRHHHYSRPARDHICASQAQMTSRTSRDMFQPGDEDETPWAAQAPAAAVAIARQNSVATYRGQPAEQSFQQHSSFSESTPVSNNPMAGLSTESKRAFQVEFIGRRPEEGLQLLRAALSKQGVHGAIMFATQIRIESTATEQGPVIGFTDIARVILRFCSIADGHIHAMFRLLDKDCYGCVRIANVIDVIFSKLTPQQLNLTKITFAALHELLQGDMEIRKLLQLEQFKNHVDHLSGRKSKATLISEFADCVATDKITWGQFQLYYRAIATCCSSNDSVFRQMVQDIWAVTIPVDQAAAVLRAATITEPSPAYTVKPGSLRRFAQPLHVGNSPVFGPASFQQTAARPEGKACALALSGTHKMSRVMLG